MFNTNIIFLLLFFIRIQSFSISKQICGEKNFASLPLCGEKNFASLPLCDEKNFAS